MLPDIQKLSERRLVLGLAILSGVLIFWNLGGAALIDWDESIYAAVAREMAEGGDWLTLHWNRETFFEKPPLYFWLTAGMFKIFGVSEFAARFWSALAGVLGTCVVYLFGKKLFGRVAGISAGLVLATTIHWVFQSRNGMLDVFAATLILLTLYFFWLGWERGGRLRHWGLFGACAGLVFLAKGPVVVIPLSVVTIFALADISSGGFSGGYSKLLRGGVFAALTFLVVAMPWHILMYRRYGADFIDEYIFYHMLARARSGIEEHGRPFLWYLVVIKHWARLWAATLLVGLLVFLRRTLRGFLRDEARPLALCLLWLILTFLIFSASASKIQWYIVPIYPPIALLCGYFLDLLARWLAPYSGRRDFPSLFMVAVFLFGIFGLLSRRTQWYVGDYNRGFAEASAMMAEVSDEGHKLLVAGAAPGVPIFYSRRKVETAKVSHIYQLSVRGHKFFAVSRQQILEDIEQLYPDVRLETFYKDFGYALYGRR